MASTTIAENKTSAYSNESNPRSCAIFHLGNTIIHIKLSFSTQKICVSNMSNNLFYNLFSKLVAVKYKVWFISIVWSQNLYKDLLHFFIVPYKRTAFFLKVIES